MDILHLWKRQSEASTNGTSATETTVIAGATGSPISADATTVGTSLISTDQSLASTSIATATEQAASSLQANETLSASVPPTTEAGEPNHSTIVLVTESFVVQSNPTDGVPTTNFVIYTTTIVTGPTITQPPTTGNTQSGGRDLSRNTGAIIGIAAGIAIFIALLVMGLSIFILRWRRKRALQDHATPESTAGTTDTGSEEGGMVEPIEKYGRERLEMSGRSAMRFELPEKSQQQTSVFELDAGVDSIRTPISGISSMNTARPRSLAHSAWSWQAGQTEKATYVYNAGESNESGRSDSTPSVADLEEYPVSPANMLSSRTNIPPSLHPGS